MPTIPISDTDVASLVECGANMTEGLLRRAIYAIDKQLGEDFSTENPALVGAYMQSEAYTWFTISFSAASQDKERELASLNMNLCKLTEKINDIASAIVDLAIAVETSRQND